PVVWRNRLYLFWVTFMDKPNSDPQPGSKTSGGSIASAKLGDLVSDIKAAAATKQVDVQLHWSERLEGEWSTRQSGGYLPAMEAVFYVDLDGTLRAALTAVPLNVSVHFNPRSAFVHVVKEPYENGEERGVFIHLSGGVNQSFYLAGRNSGPALAGYASAPANPYSSNTMLANRYSGSGALTVTFKRRISTEDGKPPVNTVETPKILEKGGGYTLLPCDNDITLGSPEIASLVKPLFYQDDAHTLFLEPNLTERTIEKWEEWVTHTPQEPVWQIPDWDKEIFVVPQVPLGKWPGPGPEDPDWGTFFDPGSLLGGSPGRDWVTNPATGVMFGDELILGGGRSGAGGPGGLLVNVQAGSGVGPGEAFVVTDAGALGPGLTQTAAGGLNVIGSAGLNAALAQNLGGVQGNFQFGG
ncbi:MAG TPA: neuraminidase-like domain-containing protein, partial [Thermoanaerobaculia bacterium]|nr:neuraminidase-like domain-containing protein [Thermoanaerobaculia bacterium]